MKTLRTLLEGGNVFKDAEGQPLTGRINQSDVPATVAWLEQLTGIEFPRERWLGSTGKAPRQETWILLWIPMKFPKINWLPN
jgi:hypothetical protein